MLTTWILYHIFCLFSTVNFIFLKFFLIVYFLKTIICDSSVIITLGVVVVNHKIQFFLIFLEVYFYRAIFPIILVAFINRNFPLLDALHRSHFQCGKCEGRRSQSSEARTPSLALPPRWARKGVLHLWCVTRLTFVCMLRYSEWDAVPIWVPGFFGTYSGMVYWAGFRILQYLQWNIILTWFPNSSIFTMERYTELVSKFFNIYSGTLYWAGFRTLQYLQ